MTLRLCGGPRALLLEMWARQAQGERLVDCWLAEGLLELVQLGYVKPAFKEKCFFLTQAGRAKAMELEGEG